MYSPVATTIRAALLLLTLLLVTSSSAAAGELPPQHPLTSTRVTDSLRIAAEFWGARLPVRVHSASHAALVRATGLPNTEATVAGRDIWIDETFLGERTSTSRVDSCTRIVHEYGHALGHGHSDDPRSVMHGPLTWRGVVYGCYRRFIRKGDGRRWRLENAGRPIWFRR